MLFVKSGDKIVKLDTFTEAYVECAFFVGVISEDGVDANHTYNISHLSQETIDAILLDCKEFQERNAELMTGLDAVQCGHDFFLTRNRHGAGFWDRGYDDKISRPLTVDSHSQGGFNLYVGDDGKLYHHS